MSSNSHVETSSVSGRFKSGLISAAIIAVAVFIACLFGIWTRPVGFLATFWPANAIMLGMLLRLPSLANPLSWAAGGAAFVIADLMTGSPLNKALVLNGANMIGITAAYLIYTQSPASRTGLRQPASMLYLLLSAAAGGATAGLVGGAANPVLFGGSMLNGWTFWFATEFVNYVAILPVILSAPTCSDLKQRFQRHVTLRKADIPPASILAVSFIAAAIIGGPGAIAFPVPILLWCGLVYPVFPTAILTLLYGVWALVVISSGYLHTQAHDEMELVSLRLGISLIAVAPIMLACVMQSRNDLLLRLHHLAMHDPLTGVSNRKAFREDAEQRLAETRRPCALVMFDLDHFKTVNDTYGHAAGDTVLIGFANRARTCLRAEDLFGRLGGEEFAAMIFDCSETQVLALAERIRLACREPHLLQDGKVLTVSTSIGIAMADPKISQISIDDLSQHADTMLYRAKNTGRDRIEISVITVDNRQVNTLTAPNLAGLNVSQS